MDFRKGDPDFSTISIPILINVINVSQLTDVGFVSEYFSYCQCDRGVAGKFCAIDTKNECELDPCGNRTDASGAIVPYQCVDRIGHFECVPTSVTASTTRAPFVDRKSDETSTWTVLVGGLASVFLLAFLIILVIKGAKGTKIVVKKTFYPAGWLEIIKGNFNSRKRRRDEPAGHYEMGLVDDGKHRCPS